MDVPQVVPTTADEPVAMVESPAVPEARQVDLFEWIEGSRLGTATADLADEKQFARIYRTAGELAARLHNHAAAWPLPAGFERHA